MQRTHSIDGGKFRRILVLVLALILILALETLLRAKDEGLYEAWKGRTSALMTPGDYLAANIISYLLASIIPVSYVLYLLIAQYKLGLTRVGSLLWSVLLGISLLYQLIRFDLRSVLYYPVLILLVLIIRLNHRLTDLTARLSSSEEERAVGFILKKEE